MRDIMLLKLRLFLAYARQYGWSNAIIFSLFKIFPRKFVLLSRKLGGASSSVSPLVAALDYRASFDSVYDYVPWTKFGGAEKAAKPRSDKPVFVWFVPDWSNVWGGGHFTLFRFAHHFSSFGCHNIIYIYNNERHSNPKALQAELNEVFENCTLEVITDPKNLPKAYVALATTWQSAYHVRAFPFALNKFYFMQDYESQFYAYGTASMQANATYTFGFRGITGGGWLKSRYEAHAGKGTAQNYRFAADKTIFFPADPGGKVRSKVKRLFFYGRPSTERRCFELGMVALKKIADHYPDVEIVIAGLDLAMEPPFKATLLGNMTLAKTGELYRTCDLGMAFSATNLSYLPVELMQSGVPVISNNGNHIEWHCEHGKNAYLVDPAPQAVLDAFAALYDSRQLRQKLADGGLKTMEPITWDDEMTKIYEYVTAHSVAR
ncbi:glycosyl transferase family 1 [Mesorhizobium sp. LSJC268A00]|nr:glycosyl transferase family 1 [Mesorhizobium sp. LSJC268A00]ESZ51552.1 glycosyl transferase family 1 [Mesorhizobium sp. L2C054A000]